MTNTQGLRDEIQRRLQNIAPQDKQDYMALAFAGQDPNTGEVKKPVVPLSLKPVYEEFKEWMDMYHFLNLTRISNGGKVQKIEEFDFSAYKNKDLRTQEFEETMPRYVIYLENKPEYVHMMNYHKQLLERYWFLKSRGLLDVPPPKAQVVDESG